MVEVKEMDTLTYFKSMLRRFEQEFGAYGVKFFVHMSSVLSDLSIQADWKVDGKLYQTRFPFEYANNRFTFDYDRAARSLNRLLGLNGGADA